jgi:hypothetical protein
MFSLMQPYPMFDINETTTQMGYSIASLDEFPINFRRTAPIQSTLQHQVENLQKLAPILVRHPWMIRIAPFLIKPRWMYRPYLVMFMLHAEYLVAEQAKIYANAQGLRGPRYWTLVDFVHRLSTKGVLRAYQTFFSKFLTRFSQTSTQIKIGLQMGDERVVAHMD